MSVVRAPPRDLAVVSDEGSAMSPATSAQVRRRQAARKQALARQQKLNEERRRRDEQELEIAAEFAVLLEECDAARAALNDAEAAMGRLVDTLVGDLRVRYHRAAQLLVTPEDELKRLRQAAADIRSTAPAAESQRQASPRSSSDLPSASTSSLAKDSVVQTGSRGPAASSTESR